MIGHGCRRIALVAPTGAGKTTISSAMIKGAIAKAKRAIFLAHRKELIEQCSDRLTDLEVGHGIIQAKHPRYNPERSVQVASVQTLIRRDHWDADLIIVDECHRSTSKTYTELISRYKNPVVIGLTATPYRQDGKGLGEIYDGLHEVISTQKLIDTGYLVEPIVYGSSNPDLSNCRISGGDYNKDDMAEAMRPIILSGKILDNWTTRFPEKDACTVIFAPKIAESKQIVQQFADAGIEAAHLDAKTPGAQREQILNDLRSRKIKVVSNVGILTEGWDLPHLECVVITRPTRSRSLYKQMVGRLMRPDDDKRFAYVLDHAGCTFMHGFAQDPEEYSLKGREKRPRKGAATPQLKECNNCRILLPAQAAICPECSFEFPKKSIEYTDEELIQLKRDALRAKIKRVSTEEKQKTLEQLCAKCIEHGYKPNWVRVKFLHAYGDWPTWQAGVRFPKFFRQYEQRLKTQQTTLGI